MQPAEITGMVNVPPIALPPMALGQDRCKENLSIWPGKKSPSPLPSPRVLGEGKKIGAAK
jgi:hypothetical protein